MFRKNNVFGKITNFSQRNKIITIGIIGSEEGIGVTHLTFMIATYFNKNMNKIKVVEWGNQNVFEKIEEAFNGEVKREEIFKMKRMCFYKNYGKKFIGELKDKNTNVVIVDFGKISAEKVKVLQEMDIKLLIGQGNDWKYKELIEAYYNCTESKNWRIGVVFGTKDEQKELNKILKTKTKTIDYYKDPFRYSKELERVVEKLIL